MLHLKVVSPSDVTPRLVETLRANPGVFSLVVLENAARSPEGDAVLFDVITAEANRVLGDLRTLGVDHRGSITVETVETSISEVVDQAEGREPRGQDFSPIWEQVDARMRSLGRYPPSWFLLMAIAGLIAAVGILVNSQILIVGAMIVGPEYFAIASVALGINTGDRPRIRRGLRALAVGFAIAILASLVFSLIVHGFELQPRAFDRGIRPVSDLINNPDFFSVVVVVLAGIVGVVSLSEARINTLVGVFVSVTTIPAAADVGVSVAFTSWREARGSLLQLLLNIVVLIVVGAFVLRFQRRVWQRVIKRSAAP
ncbi:MAG TPA: DUF389 domain-containing protein [Acidimicrobiales bacterium]|nr:DUF389 domain-containing protein [Acidimicrobiales bacterium]